MLDRHEVSQARVCRLIGGDPKTVQRKEKKTDEKIRQRMGEIAANRQRFGYRRPGLMLEREGIHMNHKKLYRLWREEGLVL